MNTTRNGYATSQCGGSLTVKELIEILDQYQDDELVFFRNDNGYTYGSIYEENITDCDSGDEA